MNTVFSKKYAKEIENMHDKTIGYSKTVCEIDENKSEPNNPYRTGQISGIKKDFKLFTDNPNFILKTNNNVSFCFIEENFGKQIGIFK